MNDIYDHAPECDVAIWLERAIETDAPRWLGVPDDVACQCQKLRACEQRVRDERFVNAIFHAPDSGARPFVLQRITDVSGVSGTGIVAHGVEFPDGCVALRWVGGNPTSVVFHDNGMASVEVIHGHGGNTQIVWTSEDMGERAAEMDEVQAMGFAAGVQAARDAVAAASLRIPYEDRRHVYLDDALAAIDALRGSGNPDTPPSAEKGEKP